MLTINEKEYEKEVLKSNAAVVDFSAEWCGSCKAVSKIIKEVALEFPAIRFYEMDISKNMDFARKKGISSLPTVVFMKKGKELTRKNGTTNKIEFKEMIQKFF